MKTEINIYVVIIILFVHWFADFVMQTDEQAKGKSKEIKWLLSHTFVYSGIWLIPIFFHHMLRMSELEMLWFVPITFFCHTLTDYFTSRLNSKLWQQGKTHLFFVSVGFDQLLHFAQLLITYQLLS